MLYLTMTLAVMYTEQLTNHYMLYWRNTANVK